MSGAGALPDATLRRVRGVWAGLAGADDFPASGTTVVGNAASEICPRGWCGVVAIGGAVLATAPDDTAAARLERLLARLEPSGDWSARFADAAECRGPSQLAYADRVQPAAGPIRFRLEPRPADDAAVVALVERVPVADREEAHVEASEAPLACLLEGRAVVAAAGYNVWRGEFAHMRVLVDPAYRGRGLATSVARAATDHACGLGLVAQWRARPPASRAVARKLGYAEVGQQISVRLT